MILLKQDTVNKIVLTLNEKTTISTPFFLFEFICDSSKEYTYFTGVDISTNKDRYNEFLIELTTNVEDRLNSVLNMPLNGFYSYNIYSQETEGNLDLENITEIVESGKVSIIGDIKPVKTIYEDGQKTKIVYNG